MAQPNTASGLAEYKGICIWLVKIHTRKGSFVKLRILKKKKKKKEKKERRFLSDNKKWYFFASKQHNVFICILTVNKLIYF